MAFSTHTMRIVGASLIAVVLVGGAYILSGPNPFVNKTANAASTDELLKAYAAKDTDGDGLPDWQEALYGTDPNNAHSVDASLTDSVAVQKGLVKPKFTTENVAATPPTTAAASAVPTTITDQFARELFTQYVQSVGDTQPTPDEVAQFVKDAVADLESKHRVPDVYAQKDVLVSGTGADALHAYLVAAQQVFAANSIPAAQDPLGYLSDGMSKGDASAFTKLSAISKAYAAIGHGLIKVPVPTEAAYAHLEMVNAMMHMSEVSADMAAFQTDPLRTTLGLGTYDEYTLKFQQSFADLFKVLQAENVQIPAGQPGSDLYTACRLAAS